MKRTISQTKKTSTAKTTTTKKNRKSGRWKIYKAITSSAEVDIFGQIRDSAVIENMRAFILLLGHSK